MTLAVCSWLAVVVVGVSLGVPISSHGLWVYVNNYLQLFTESVDLASCYLYVYAMPERACALCVVRAYCVRRACASCACVYGGKN